jgi:hypothetical protein
MPYYMGQYAAEKFLDVKPYPSQKISREILMDAEASFLLSQSILSEGREERAGTSELIHLRSRVMYSAVNWECGFEVSRSWSAFGI